MTEKATGLHPHFEDLEQQREAARAGMWLFLASELMFFGGLFMAYAVYHFVYPSSFGATGKHTNLLCGSINTALLLTSGLTMSLTLHAIETGKRKSGLSLVLTTILLGLGFIAVLAVEYATNLKDHFVPGNPLASISGKPASEIFLYIYWAMTGVHAIHIIVGLGFLMVMAYLIQRNRLSQDHHAPLEMATLYWGFVIIIWLWIYPLIYLFDRHQP